MERTFRSALSRAVTRALGSRFGKPIARVALAGAALVLLALIGRTAALGAINGGAETSSPGLAAQTPAQSSSADHSPPPRPDEPRPPTPTGVASTANTAQSSPRASADDPVVLNTATEIDLRRLPGIGAKRANAIVALRVHLGRFRAVEDLLKVKGIGRATLKRLRPLMRLDPSPSIDAGGPRPATGP
jgi:competence protein ComEA